MEMKRQTCTVMKNWLNNKSKGDKVRYDFLNIQL
jgi:hypothetical protein